MTNWNTGVRPVKIKGTDTVCGQFSLIASPEPSDKFDRIALFESVAPEIVEKDSGSLVGERIFVDIYKVTTHTGEKLARARPYEYQFFGTLPYDKKSYKKRVTAEFVQGSKTAKINGFEIDLGSEALITGNGTVEVEINIDQVTLSSHIVNYSTKIPSVGDIVEANIPKTSDKENAVVLTQDGNYKIKLAEKPIFGGDVKVEILENENNIEGRVVDYGEETPSEGDRINTELKRMTQNVPITQSGVNFEIELDEQPITTGEITVLITEVGNAIKGKVTSYGDLPKKDEVIKLTGDQQNKPAVVSPKGEQYKIHLAEPLLINGEVSVRIISNNRPIQGEIESYHGQLPKVGKIIRGTIFHKPSGTFAESNTLGYQIHIEGETEYTGPAKIEIIDVSKEGISGEIVEEITSTQKRTTDTENPFKQQSGENNDLIS